MRICPRKTTQKNEKKKHIYIEDKEALCLPKNQHIITHTVKNMRDGKSDA